VKLTSSAVIDRSRIRIGFSLIGVSGRKRERLNEISRATGQADPFPKRPGLDTIKV